MNRSCAFSTMEQWYETYIGIRLVLVKLLCVFSLCLLTAACAVQFSYAADTETVDLFLDISFDSNLLLNKYDVSIELDGERLGTAEYGKYYTKLCEVVPGKHTVRVFKDDDSEVVGEKSFQVKEDTTFQCKLKTKRNEIEFEEAKKIKGTAGHSIEMPDCVGFHLVDAQEVLKKKGYVNYHYEGGDPEEKVNEETWAVDSQNVKTGEKIDKNDEIILTCIPAGEYVKKTFAGMTYTDAIAKATAIGYKNIKRIDARHKGDTPTELNVYDITGEAEPYWTVKSAKDNYSEDATLILNFVYNVPMPDLLGKGAEKADNLMKSIRQGHFSCEYVGYKTGDDISDEDLEKYKIVEQSVEPETNIPYNSTIILKCKKTKAAKEAEKRAAQEELERKLNLNVWYTDTGDCYHTKRCWHLRSERGPITQREAIQKGLEPCDDCMKAGNRVPNWERYR